MLAGCGALMQCSHSITTDITSASSRRPFIFRGVNEEVVTAVVPHSAQVGARSHGERKSGLSLASEIRWRDCHVIHRVRASQAAILYSSPLFDPGVAYGYFTYLGFGARNKRRSF
jgi:hypothetical protein